MIKLSIDRHFCGGNNVKPSLAIIPPLSSLTMFFTGPAHQVYCITSNLDISASRQNRENLTSSFGAIHVGIMHA